MKDDTQTLIQERFKKLPQKVQDSIQDTGIETILRHLAKKYKLHLDHWITLENEIMLTLLDIHDPEDMVDNIVKETDVRVETAQKIVDDIARQVFLPIRTLIQHSSDTPTPENTSQPQKKQTPSDTTAYKTGENSASRREVQEDPYRETI